MVFAVVQPSQNMGAIDSNDIFAGQVQLLPAQIYTQHHLVGCKYIYNDYIYTKPELLKFHYNTL